MQGPGDVLRLDTCTFRQAQVPLRHPWQTITCAALKQCPHRVLFPSKAHKESHTVSCVLTDRETMGDAKGITSTQRGT